MRELGRGRRSIGGMGLLALLLAACGSPAPSASLAPDNHAAFPISDGTVHEKLECATCHGSFDSFTKFNCHSSGCHAEPATTPKHVNAAGYEYLSQSCYLCHPRGKRGVGVDHSISFPIAQGTKHQNTSCSVCHTQPSKPLEVTCADSSCHSQIDTDATHPDSLGYVWGPSTCLKCHANGTVGSVDHKVLFPIGAGDRHGDVACVTCHQDVTSYSIVTCTTGSCHARQVTDNWHDAVLGYEYASASCLGCHPNSQTNLVDHARFFPIKPGEVHGTQACATCHTTGDRKQFSCTTSGCHEEATTDNTHGAVLGYEYLSSSCLGCHPNAKRGQADHGKFFPISSGEKHAGVACESCHRDPVKRTPVTCVGAGCHVQSVTDPIHAGFPSYAYASGSCLNCHIGGTRTLNHSYFPVAAGTSHAGLACAACHSQPSDRHILNCANAPCHDPVVTLGKHTLVGGYQWLSTMCVLCHGDGAVPRITEHLPWGITPDYPHTKKPCLQCHPSVRLDRPALADFGIRNCFSAGCHILAAVSTLHAIVAPIKYRPEPETCIMAGCHQNGRKP